MSERDAGPAATAERLLCPLCGWRFDAGDAARACQACPLVSSCHLLRCPRCSYEWSGDSQLVNWLKERWRLWRRGGADARTD